jgi:chromosome segregation ATPase
VLKGEQDQNGVERAAEYLGRSDPETALNGLQARIASTEQAIQFHQQRNQSGDLIGCVEAVRQQQQEVKHKLGDVIAKRRSIEASISQLQSSQDEMEQNISVMEQNADGETLERRLQKLSQFIEARTLDAERSNAPCPAFWSSRRSSRRFNGASGLWSKRRPVSTEFSRR